MTRTLVLSVIAVVSVLGPPVSWAGVEELPTVEDNVEEWRREKSAVFFSACRASSVHSKLLVIRAGANDGNFFIIQDGLLSSGKRAVIDGASIEFRNGQWRITDASGGVGTQQGIAKSIEAMLQLPFKFLNLAELDQIAAARGGGRPCPDTSPTLPVPRR